MSSGFLLGDVERVSVVGAKGDERRGAVVQKRRQRAHVLARAAIADQHLDALSELLLGLWPRRALVAVMDAAGGVGVEPVAGQQRRMSVDTGALERDQFIERLVRVGEDVIETHELGESDIGGMAAVANQVGGRHPRAGGLEPGRRHAARQLHLEVHHRVARALEKVVEPRRAQHVDDLMRIADRGRGAARQRAAVELGRRHAGALDMDVGVDKARHDHGAAPVERHLALVAVVHPDDHVAGDGDVAVLEFAAHQVEYARVPNHHIGGLAPERLVDPPLERVLGQGHRGLRDSGSRTLCFRFR